MNFQTNCGQKVEHSQAAEKFRRHRHNQQTHR